MILILLHTISAGDGKKTLRNTITNIFNGFLDNYNKTYSEMYIHTEINHLHNHKSLGNLSYRPSNDYIERTLRKKNLKKHIADNYSKIKI
jgi:hypothetical protein